MRLADPSSFAGSVGMPSGRRFPLAFGTYTRRTGTGSQVEIVWCTRTAISARSVDVRATCPSTPAVRRPALRCVTCRTLTSVFDQDRSIIFCRDRTWARFRSRVALKILRRSRRTLPSWAGQLMASQSGTSSGPFIRVRPDAELAVEQRAEGWRVRWVLAQQGGSLVPRSVKIEPEDRQTPPGGITSNLLRGLSPARVSISAAASRAEGVRGNDFRALTLRWAERDAAELGPETAEPRRSGRPQLSESLLRDIAIADLGGRRER